MNPISEFHATDKTCPFMSRSGTVAQGCVGSNCMAWEWVDRGRKTIICENQTAYLEPPRPAMLPKSWTFVPYRPEDGDDPACWIESEEEFRHRRRGKCLRLTPPPSDVI